MNPIHKIAQFLREYETLCHRHSLIVDTLGFEHYDPVVKAASAEMISEHLTEIRELHKSFVERNKKDVDTNI